LQLAWLQFSTGEAEQALATLQSADAIDPSQPQAAFARGDVLLALKRFDEAEQAYREGLRRAPDQAQGHHGLGLVAEQRGARAQAPPPPAGGGRRAPPPPRRGRPRRPAGPPPGGRAPAGGGGSGPGAPGGGGGPPPPPPGGPRRLLVLQKGGGARGPP